MDLNETLRSAVAEPPPTSIDLDVLIKRERRRERQQRWLAGGGIAAGVAATIGVAAGGFAGTLPLPFAGGGAPPCPVVSPKKIPPNLSGSMSADELKKKLQASAEASVTGKPTTDASATAKPLPGGGKVDSSTKAPRPVPSEPCGTAATRFNRALTDALHRVAPSAKLTNADDEHRTPVWFQRYGDDSFVASVLVRDGDRTNGLYVEISSYAERPTGDQICAKLPPSGGCQTLTGPDGTLIAIISDDITYNVQVYRPDGTQVMAAVKPLSAPRTPVLGADQLRTIAETPEFTLFP